MLSYYQVLRRIWDLSGVVPIAHDMCVKSCMAYTGVFSQLVSCKFCNEPRYMTHIQALFRNPQSVHNMWHRHERMQQILEELEANNVDFPSEYNDVYCGQDYLDAVRSGNIHDDSIVVSWSEDGAQLYQSKKSDAWIGIWTFILPGVIIPGPNNPWHLDSFIFPSLHHVGTLQNGDLKVWDAHQQRIPLLQVMSMGGWVIMVKKGANTHVE
ncbi:hypothetical protein ARMGADRAFT_1046875 [Armillaria gallica]|uniref:Uncharacterized protein n=1 Tax=Armillaria gallica TaxID=47427 RepID=A0A2H3DQ26_ARMGA|nr:hypothetical protein ARMGADRAFT_1046875 [Armillaria gallica]